MSLTNEGLRLMMTNNMPATVQVGLGTAAPPVTGLPDDSTPDAVNELPTAGGYDRTMRPSLQWPQGFEGSLVGSNPYAIWNRATIEFMEATAAWPTFQWGLMFHPNGQLIAFDELPQAITLAMGQQFTFPATQFRLRLRR